MERLVTSNLKMGIIAGGQLGKMLIQEASKWNIITYVLDKDEDCPAGKIASHFVKGSNLDFNDVYQFGKQVDILTFEIENVNIEALNKLKSEGVRILPDPDILALIQDKGLQKDFYRNNHIPTSPFRLVQSEQDILKSIDNGDFSFPFVQKLRKGGYDGKGVAVINSASDLNKLLPGPSVIEEKVEIDKEIAAIVARNNKGEIKCYPIVEMLFDPQANLVDKLICPSSITVEQSEKAKNIASEIIELLNMEGLLAVEFFIDSKGEVIVNEVAPRTHNSGHHTIESIVTSQFEQHLRAILNLPLGSTKLKLPSVMINILGEEGHHGNVLYEGLTESMAIDGVKIHLYGKKITQPYRKMGHITVLSPSLECALKKAEKVKQLIKVKSWTKN
ncbi:5-(carboxyamino)imidazole ribonucleotide synthase [Carboxylicivirga sediminis]|uniref:N5-carboxyaminoimidazole ribonucleotide synthase n=1 Tax=Carboxylicivirga sediminis TaxID=2006564 RepID=A0A941J2U6_9BACT|nr:5-(carboxyamino)imidazole ribonucleotide synthase [Carboxylicivirga sediminis]MBR8538152.1 5-(carboxyamino)imidazole ribonucleotide synthase [Carboxylicivirga sediminis]